MAACGDGVTEAPVIDLTDLNGPWTYEVQPYVGAGRSCHSLPAVAWAITKGTVDTVTSYGLTAEQVTFVCAVDGAIPDTFRLGLGDDARVIFLSLSASTGGEIRGCPFPGYIWADDGGSARARLEGPSCGTAAAVDEHTLTFDTDLFIAFPDPNADVSTLTGTVTFTRR